MDGLIIDSNPNFESYNIKNYRFTKIRGKNICIFWEAVAPLTNLIGSGDYQINNLLLDLTVQIVSKDRDLVII